MERKPCRFCKAYNLSLRSHPYLSLCRWSRGFHSISVIQFKFTTSYHYSNNDVPKKSLIGLDVRLWWASPDSFVESVCVLR